MNLLLILNWVGLIISSAILLFLVWVAIIMVRDIVKYMKNKEYITLQERLYTWMLRRIQKRGVIDD